MGYGKLEKGGVWERWTYRRTLRLMLCGVLRLSPKDWLRGRAIEVGCWKL